MEWKDYVLNDPTVLFSDKRVKSLLKDVYMNDSLHANLMMNAYNIGIISDMRKSYPPDRFATNRWTKKMISDYGVSKENASWAIETWVSVLSPHILSQLDQEETNGPSLPLTKATSKENEKKHTNLPVILQSRSDNDDYYVNPSHIESKDYIYVPCGFGQSDHGFEIHGIKKECICTHPDANVYALIYNYLIRNSTISEDDIPLFLQKQNTVYELDYQSIYRLAIVLLQMIRHNCISGGTVLLNYSDNEEPLKYAVSLINDYAKLFCRLIGIPPVHLQVKRDKAGTPLTINGFNNGIYITSITGQLSNARELWYGRKINYHLTKENLPDLEYILREISNFDSFKEGQFLALCNMLASKRHAVCIMPTGSGKSLIFYIASLLQPLPIFIVAPTDILIQDQIRNLKKFHHMDNVAHLMLTTENCFSKWEVYNSLNYLTPMTFQNRNLLIKFRYLNAGTRLNGRLEERIAEGSLVSYIVLDEIHCLSNWGHDFRPEYLMLSKYLNKYFDHVTFWGFTATANYTVVEDVQKQLNIPQNNFFSPIAFEHFNISYDFRTYHTEKEMLQAVAEITAPLINRNERTIVFTKSDEISEKVADAIGFEADIYSRKNPKLYYHFAAGESKILVASDELGVGINLPNIRNVIHFGLPLSKNEYVQEIGRAGRANEKVKSYILYLDNTEDNVHPQLLKRDTPIQNLPALLKAYDNDYSQVYRKLSNGAISSEELYNQLIKVYHGFVDGHRASYSNPYPKETIEKQKQYFYMLYLTGYVYDWYSLYQSQDGKGIYINIDICSNDALEYRKDPQKMLNRMKDHMREYFYSMGNDRESIAKIERTTDPREIIEIYVKWYYAKYLYHHNEQFLDFFDFIVTNASCDRDKITEEIKDYFTLPFAKLQSDETLYNNLSIKEIAMKIAVGISKSSMNNLEIINSNRYSYKLDLALFCGQLCMMDVFDENRLKRIISNLNQSETGELRKALPLLYHSCNTQCKIDLLNYIERNPGSLRTTCDAFLRNVYGDGKKDTVYYGIMAKRLNKYFERVRSTSNV